MLPRKRPAPSELLPLDMDAPMRSLRALTPEGVRSMARLRDRSGRTQCSQESAGPRIELTTLLQAAEALGYRLHLYAEKI